MFWNNADGGIDDYGGEKKRLKASSHNVTITSKKLEKTNLTMSQSSMCGQAIDTNLGRK
jgi:hypothetical protein